MNPQVQGLINSQIGNNTAESGIESQLAGNASHALSQPLNLTDPSALQQTINKQNAVTLDPYWQRQDEQTQQQAYNQGLAPGSAGYSALTQNEGTLKNQSYGQAWQGSAAQAQNALQQQYNSPLNALNALKSGSQISQPGVGQTAQTPQTSVAGTNIAGLIEQNYQSQLAQSNAAMGGLFGLGGSAISALGMFSDRRLKNVVSVLGTRPDGLKLYAWRYVWGGPVRSGPMADEVRAIYPDAVFECGGYLAIDPARIP